MRITVDARVRLTGSTGVISPSLPPRDDISRERDGGRHGGINARRRTARAATVKHSVGMPRLGFKTFLALRPRLVRAPGRGLHAVSNGNSGARGPRGGRGLARAVETRDVAALGAPWAKRTRKSISTFIGIGITSGLAMRAIGLHRGTSLESTCAIQAQRAAARAAAAGSPGAAHAAGPANERDRGDQPSRPRGARLGTAGAATRRTVKRSGRSRAAVRSTLAIGRDGAVTTGADPTTIEDSTGGIERPGRSWWVANLRDLFPSEPVTSLVAARSGNRNTTGDILSSGREGTK